DPSVQASCLAAAGLPPTLYNDAMSDQSTEAEVISESREALDRGALGTPSMAISGTNSMLFGPIIGVVPAGHEALSLWDSVYAALQTPYVFEMKRNRKTSLTSQFAD